MRRTQREFIGWSEILRSVAERLPPGVVRQPFVPGALETTICQVEVGEVGIRFKQLNAPWPIDEEIDPVGMLLRGRFLQIVERLRRRRSRGLGTSRRCFVSGMPTRGETGVRFESTIGLIRKVVERSRTLVRLSATHV